METIYIKNKLIKPLSVFVLLLFTLPLLHIINISITNQNSQPHKITILKNVSVILPAGFEFSSVDLSLEVMSNFSFKTFIGSNNKYSFKYPTCFNLSEKNFEGGEIIKHIDFICKSMDTTGLFQIWNYKNGLLSFLSSAKSNPSPSMIDFSEQPIHKDNLNGYIWEYTVINDQQKKYKANEVFFEKNKNIYRLSYFVPLDKWNNDQKKIFDEMVKSLQIK